MITQSILLGVLFGTLWGSLFVDRYKRLCSTSTQNTKSKGSSCFLASTSTIRYLLLAALLGILFIKKYILLSWWIVGFMGAFWGLIIWSARAKTTKE